MPPIVDPTNLYSEAGVWLDYDAGRGMARAGLSDYRQQVSGDAAFARDFFARYITGRDAADFVLEEFRRNERADFESGLDQAAEAHRYLEGRQSKGKVLLIP